MKLCLLFEFNSTWWFAGEVIEYAVHPFDFVYDAVHDLLKHLIRDVHGFGGHKVICGDGTENYGVIVGPEISHDTD